MIVLVNGESFCEISVSQSLVHEFYVKPNSTYSGVIIITNSENKKQRTKVYQSDYLFSANGKNQFDTPAGNLPRSNANWISFSPRSFTIPPKDIFKVEYEIKVPKDSTLIGSYWSLFLVEGIPDKSKRSVDDKHKLFIISRIGIQIVTHIGNTGTRELTFLDLQFLEKEQKRILQVDVENTGERFLHPYLWVELYDLQGKFVGKYETSKLRTYPGTSVRFNVDLTEVPSGSYQALIVADCGGDDLFGANVNLEIPEIKSNQQEETIGE